MIHGIFRCRPVVVTRIPRFFPTLNPATCRFITTHLPTGEPTLEYAKTQPTEYYQLSNMSLFALSQHRIHGAHKERLIREVMCVEDLDHADASKVIAKMEIENSKINWALLLPYKIGIVVTLVLSFASIPLCFHKDTAIWFQQKYVEQGSEIDEGLEIPDFADLALDTPWKVGAWTWGWMEPPIGTLSFMLLCMALGRVYTHRMQWVPYHKRLLMFRANRLAKHHPNFKREIVYDFAMTQPYTEVAWRGQRVLALKDRFSNWWF